MSLVIVHVEPEFQESFDEKLPGKIASYAKRFKRAVNVTMGICSNDIFNELANCEQQHWLYGYDAEYYQQENPKITEGIDFIKTTGHEYSELVEWMMSFGKKETITLVGGARWECLQDVKECLEFLGYKTKVNNKFIYLP